MNDYMKAIETLETMTEENTEEDEELLQEADPIDDLTISTTCLKESSDVCLDIPMSLPMPRQVELAANV